VKLVHEMSLMEGVAKVVQEKARENNINSISKVKLVVGKLTNALPEALQLAFFAFKETETIYNPHAVLEIEERMTVGKCGNCRQEFEITEGDGFSCSGCSSLNITILSGRELYVEYFEGE
ncbi:MAG: hydrogenase maturation nickel metallochaperone HypA, partial [Clostridia bacterium]|nr:hydrogenase maturation nickel metallochaperone HypA [Clostridia bacterium]